MQPWVAGWYSDPSQPSRLRFWNGVTWDDAPIDELDAAVPRQPPMPDVPGGTEWSWTGSARNWTNPNDRDLPDPPDVASQLLAEQLAAESIVVTVVRPDRVSGAFWVPVKRRSKWWIVLWLLVFLPCLVTPCTAIPALIGVTAYLIRRGNDLGERVGFTLALRPHGTGTRVTPVDLDIVGTRVDQVLEHLSAGRDRPVAALPNQAPQLPDLHTLTGRLLSDRPLLGWAPHPPRSTQPHPPRPAGPGEAREPRPVMADVGVPQLRRMPDQWNWQFVGLASVAFCLLIYQYLEDQHLANYLVQPEHRKSQLLVAFSWSLVLVLLGWLPLRTYRWAREPVLPAAVAATVIVLCTWIVWEVGHAASIPFIGLLTVIVLLMSRAAPGRTPARFTREWQSRRDLATADHAQAIAAWQSRNGAPAEPDGSAEPDGHTGRHPVELPDGTRSICVFGGLPVSWDLLMATMGGSLLGTGQRIVVLHLGHRRCADGLAWIAAGHGRTVRHTRIAPPWHRQPPAPVDLDIVDLVPDEPGSGPVADAAVTLADAVVTLAVGADVLVVAGADELDSRHLEALRAAWDRPSTRLVLLFAHLRDPGAGFVRSTQALTVIMRLADPDQAGRATTMIGPDGTWQRSGDAPDLTWLAGPSARSDVPATRARLEHAVAWGVIGDRHGETVRGNVTTQVVQELAGNDMIVVDGTGRSRTVDIDPLLAEPRSAAVTAVRPAPAGRVPARGTAALAGLVVAVPVAVVVLLLIVAWQRTVPAPTTLPAAPRATLTGPDRYSVIYGMVLSPDGNTLAGATGQDVHLWNMATRQRTATLPSAASNVGSLTFSPDGRNLAGGAGGNIYLWNVASSTLTTTFNAPGDGNSTELAFSPDGRTLAVGDSKSDVHLVNIATATTTARFHNLNNDPLDSGVTAVVFSPDGGTVAAGDQDGGTYLWNIATGKLSAALTQPGQQGVRGVAYSRDGGMLVAGDQAGHLYLWNVATGALVTTLADPGGGGVGAVALSPDNATLAASDVNGDIYLWNLPERRLVGTFRNAQPDAMTGGARVLFNADGSTLACANGIGRIYLWDTSWIGP